MILPTKHITTSHSLLGVGAELLGLVETQQSVSRLWEKARGLPTVGNFERFILALDLLFALDLVTFEGGLLGRSDK